MVLNVWTGMLPVPLVVLPVIPVAADDVQANVPPEGTEVGVTSAVEPPEQTVCGVIAFTVGVGFTVTVNVPALPMHVATVGVIVYVTVPAAVAVVIKAWEGMLPVPLVVLPLMPVKAEDDHVNVPPDGVDTGVTSAVEPPEQTVCGVIAFTVGVGFTVTVNVPVVPAHVATVGVMVYVTVPAAVAVVLNV